MRLRTCSYSVPLGSPPGSAGPREFGERVKFWITLNELAGPGTYAYIAAHNQTLAHARAVQAYNTFFQLLKSVMEDKVNVKGYYAWSLLDNFEWTRGYTEKFGLHRADRTTTRGSRGGQKIWLT